MCVCVCTAENSDYVPTFQWLTYDASSSQQCVQVQLLTSFASVNREDPEVFYLTATDTYAAANATCVILESRMSLHA